jgi:hypothetical protein
MGWDKSTFPRNEALVFIEGNISKLHGTYLDVGINEEVLLEHNMLQKEKIKIIAW